MKEENSPSFLEIRLCVFPIVPDLLGDWLLSSRPAASQEVGVMVEGGAEVLGS